MCRRPSTAPVVDSFYEGREVTTSPETVEVMLELKSVQKLDPITQTMSISIKEYIQWHDPRLAFNITGDASCVFGSLSPGGKTRILLRNNDYSAANRRVWRPDPYVVNKVSEFISKQLMYLYENGLMSMFKAKSVITACPMVSYTQSLLMQKVVSLRLMFFL